MIAWLGPAPQWPVLSRWVYIKKETLTYDKCKSGTEEGSARRATACEGLQSTVVELWLLEIAEYQCAVYNQQTSIKGRVKALTQGRAVMQYFPLGRGRYKQTAYLHVL